MIHTPTTAETAACALDGLRAATEVYLTAVRAPLLIALQVGSYAPDVDSEIDYLCQVIEEHFRAQCHDAFEAVDERYEAVGRAA